MCNIIYPFVLGEGGGGSWGAVPLCCFVVRNCAQCAVVIELFIL